MPPVNHGSDGTEPGASATRRPGEASVLGRQGEPVAVCCGGCWGRPSACIVARVGWCVTRCRVIPPFLLRKLAPRTTNWRTSLGALWPGGATPVQGRPPLACYLQGALLMRPGKWLQRTGGQAAASGPWLRHAHVVGGQVVAIALRRSVCHVRRSPESRRDCDQPHTGDPGILAMQHVGTYA